MAIQYPHGLTVTPFMVSDDSSFGAEVGGVDFSVSPLPQPIIDTMIQIQNKYAVTVYRKTGLDDARHVAFSFQLGDLERCPKFSGPDVPDRFSSPYLFDAGNMDIEGNLVKKGTRRWAYNLGNALWHTDSSFNQHRSKYSMLLAHELPSIGGDTGFCDVRRAYADLSDEKKAEIADLVVEHDLWHSRKLAAPLEFAKMTEHELAAKQPAFHRLVTEGPDGQPTLFIAAHSKCIVGWPQEKGFRLIQELIAHCTQPKYCFAMKWQDVGDLVWWDNRQSMHRATTFSDQMERRDMRRTTIFDDGPHSHGVDPNVLADMPAA